MRSCIKKLHQEMTSDEILRIVLTNDYELTIKKADKVTSSGRLIIILRTNGRKVVVNPRQVLFACTQEARV